LIAAADLQFAILITAKHIKIECLKQHVTELRVTDARLAVLHARAHALLATIALTEKCLPMSRRKSGS